MGWQSGLNPNLRRTKDLVNRLCLSNINCNTLLQLMLVRRQVCFSALLTDTTAPTLHS